MMEVKGNQRSPYQAKNRCVNAAMKVL